MFYRCSSNRMSEIRDENLRGEAICFLWQISYPLMSIIDQDNQSLYEKLAR